ncbi:MAG: cytochrome d ubiquinol oxidase subunit II [Deltaproteobacteria bacterium]|nr:cytochrome d ubiquinol oxidase subunit II [Deltaproteobacteria bacterium]
MDLNLFWFITCAFLLSGYAILDGFDLGGAANILWCKKEEDKQVIYKSIGPVWDGNEVWLVTFGASFFAAFPDAYATIFSGFYLPLILVLVCLITRAITIEFRNKLESPRARTIYDTLFGTSSLLVLVLLGVAGGAIIKGVPVNESREFVGSFWDIVTPYTVLGGVLIASVMLLHGSFYVSMKGGEEMQKALAKSQRILFGVFLVTYVVTVSLSIFALPHVAESVEAKPIAWVAVAIAVLAVLSVLKSMLAGKPGKAFASTTVAILAHLACYVIVLFPNLVISSLNEYWNMTVYNAASSQKTLGIMQIIAIIGLPLVIIYNFIIYWVFRGKVQAEDAQY